jgi:hypothetical protein
LRQTIEAPNATFAPSASRVHSGQIAEADGRKRKRMQRIEPDVAKSVSSRCRIQATDEG